MREASGIREGLIRLAVGLEDARDIRGDLAKDARISRVIVWEESGVTNWPEEEVAKAGLSGKWKLVGDEGIVAKWN